MGLSSNLFYILLNIYNVVSITHIGNGFECNIFVKLIVMGLLIGNKVFWGGGGWYKGSWAGADVVKVWSLGHSLKPPPYLN